MARRHPSADAFAETLPPPVVYVDVDDTLVRSAGPKRIPMTAVIEHVRALHREGAIPYCWSRGGADYARSSARELGIEDCFVGFLPTPDAMRCSTISRRPTGRTWSSFIRTKLRASRSPTTARSVELAS